MFIISRLSFQMHAETNILVPRKVLSIDVLVSASGGGISPREVTFSVS